jgi:hypothetical protein
MCCVATWCAALQHGVLHCNMVVCCIATWWCAALQHGVLRGNMVWQSLRTPTATTDLRNLPPLRRAHSEAVQLLRLVPRSVGVRVRLDELSIQLLHLCPARVQM